MILVATVEQEGKLKLMLFPWDRGFKYHKVITRIYKYEYKVNLILLVAKSGFDTLIKPKYNKALLKKENAVFYV